MRPVSIQLHIVFLAALLMLAACSRSSFEARIREAEGKLGVGEPASALAIYRGIVQEYPDDPRIPGVALRIADIQGIVLGDEGEALSVYADVIRRYPLSEASMLARERHADILVRRGDFSGAIEDYAALLKYFPQHADRYRYRLLMAGAYLSQRNCVRARAELVSLLEGTTIPAGVRAQALFVMGESFFIENQPRMAIPYYERLLHDFPNASLVPEARLHLATCLEEMGRLGMAREVTAQSREEYGNRRVVDMKLQAIGKRGSDRPAVPGREGAVSSSSKTMDKGE